MPAPQRPLARRVLILCAALACVSCGGGGVAPVETAPEPAVDAGPADISVLMMGNSHTSVSGLPQHLGDMLRAARPGKTVSIVVAPGSMFLEERVSDVASLSVLRSRAWSAVVLQAQKYSSSGLYRYSTEEAQALVGLVRAGAAQPLLFPEWPRRGVLETQRIYELHVGIALKAPACVAPIGQAWDLALQRHPTLTLHAADGNHADLAGAYLAALMLFATLTGASPLTLPDLNNTIDPTVQRQLRQAAANTALVTPARQHCPLDLPL